MTPTIARGVDVERVVADLVARVAEAERRAVDMAARLEQLEHRIAPRPIDDRELVAAIIATCGRLCFTAKELHKHRRVDPVLAAALRGLTKPRHIGRRLRALADAGVSVDGFRLSKIGRETSGCIWTLIHGERCDGSRDGA